MNGGPWGPVGLIGLGAGFLYDAWSVVTGPQNLKGWVFFLSLPLVGLATGWLAGRRQS